MNLPDLRGWLFSLRSFAAASLALYVALALDLPRPYWAFGTVYIVTQASAGAVRSKGLWRFVGTLAGGAFAVTALPTLSSAPVLLTIAIGMWVGGCLVLSLLDPTPRSYAFMLAGYTAAFIAFPLVDAPGTVFDYALGRVEEIGLGIACTYLVHGVLFPRPGTPLLLSRVRAWLADTGRFAADALRGPIDPDRFAADRRRIARDSAALDQMFHQARYEAAETRHAIAWLPALRDRARLLPTLISAIADRSAALRAADPAVQAAMQPLLQRVGDWMQAMAEPADRGAVAASGPLLRRLRHEEATAAQDGSWAGLVREGLAARLIELVETTLDCLDLARRVTGAAHGAELGAPRDSGIRTPGHADPLLIGLSGLAAFLSVVVTCAFWILSGWPAGASAGLMAAVAACFFAQMDDPAPAILQFILGSLVAVVLAGLYMFALLPAIDGFPLLVAALGLAFIPLGALQTVPAMMGLILPAAVTFPTLVGLQGSYAADLPNFLDGSIATVIGLAIALVVTRLTRSVGVAYRLRRLAAADRRDLARLTEQRRTGDLLAVATPMFDRFEAMAARLGAADPRSIGVQELAPLRAAANVLRLRALMHGNAGPLHGRLEEALGAIRRHATGREPSAETLRRLDDTLALATAGTEPGARAAALALSGTRMALFPDAPPPKGPPQGSPQGSPAAPELREAA